MKKSQPAPRRGVTIVELLIIISILAILATLSVAFFRKQIFKSQDAKKKADIRRFQTTIEEYEKDHDCYPTEYSLPADYQYQAEGSVCPTWYKITTLLDADIPYSAGSPNEP